jgi:hypothetical protein
VFDKLHAPHIAALLFLLIDATQGAKREPAGLLERPAARDLELDPLLDVELKLIREFLLKAVATQKGSQTQCEPAEPTPLGHGNQISLRRTTREIAPASRSQLAVSRSRARRPARVSA